MRTLHKLVWVLRQQRQPLSATDLKLLLPGKKKPPAKEIEFLLASYAKHETKYVLVTELNSMKLWSLSPQAFPDRFWQMK